MIASFANSVDGVDGWMWVWVYMDSMISDVHVALYIYVMCMCVYSARNIMARQRSGATLAVAIN